MRPVWRVHGLVNPFRSHRPPNGKKSVNGDLGPMLDAAMKRPHPNGRNAAGDAPKT
jgi:hypothetical protein